MSHVNELNPQAVRVAHAAKAPEDTWFVGGRITQIALRTFAAVAITGGAVVIGLSFAYSVAAPIILTGIPFILLGIVSAYTSMRVKEYQYAKVLASVRKDVEGLSLDQIAEKYGWKSLFSRGILTREEFQERYRSAVQKMDLISMINYYEMVCLRLSESKPLAFQYQVPPPREFKSKWAPKSLEEILETYPLDKIEKYSLVDSAELRRILELKVTYDQAKGRRDVARAPFLAEHQQELAPFERTKEEQYSRADRIYAESPAVVQRPHLLKEHLNAKGEIQKRSYADQDRARSELRQLEMRYEEQCQRIEREVVQAVEQRDRMKREADARMQELTAPYRNAFADKTREMEAEFRRSVEDLNALYAAYIRASKI
ncbi:MAG: hypothetical protein JSS61_00580 [Verrucomicrobia bacterium]|nr:hypothetical protein [Verrucomicrobiota bacterium]